MINVSNTFRGILSIGPEWHTKIEYQLKNGETGTLTDMDLMANSLQFINSTSPRGSFEVGQAASQGLKLALNNYQGKFTESELEGAVFTPQVGLVTRMDWQGFEMEWCKRGVFTADDIKSVGKTIRILAVDDMAKFDRVYSESALTYPATLGQIVMDACSVCGVTLATPTFTNLEYVVSKRPSDTSTTFRDIVSYVAALSGNFARINANRGLELRWYDFSKFDLPDDDPNRPVDLIGITSSDIAKSDTVITGVEITGNDSDKTIYKAGKDGFTISIGNPLAQDGLQELANSLGDKLIGFAFRPFSADANGNPAVEAGDVCYIKDSSGNSYRSLISNLTYTLSGSESFSADAESSAQNQSKYFSPAQKAQDAADKANNGVEEAKASIEILNGEIVLKVSLDKVISAINLSPEKITIDTNRLNINGLVTISNLENGETVVDGACIKTGRIESKNGKYWLDMETGKVYMEDGTFAGTINWGGNNYINSNNGQTTISAENGMDINAQGGDIHINDGPQNGMVYTHDLEAKFISSRYGSFDTLNGADPATGTIALMRYNGTDKVKLHFTRGIFEGAEIE